MASFDLSKAVEPPNEDFCRVLVLSEFLGAAEVPALPPSKRELLLSGWAGSLLRTP